MLGVNGGFWLIGKKDKMLFLAAIVPAGYLAVQSQAFNKQANAGIEMILLMWFSLSTCFFSCRNRFASDEALKIFKFIYLFFSIRFPVCCPAVWA